MSGSEHDCVEVGAYNLTVLTIKLRDVAGHVLDLKGSHWSATLVMISRIINGGTISSCC
jgi:hypothetical protein